MSGLVKALAYLLLSASLGVAFAYTWLGTGLGDLERRLPRRVMGFYGRYGQWPTSVADLERGMRSSQVQSLRQAVRGRSISFKEGPKPRQLTIVVNGLLPFSGRRIEVSCENKPECERLANFFFEPLPEPGEPGELPPAARWM